MTETVFVNAVAVTEFGNGLFGIQLKVRELTPDEAKVLRELFPHTERAMQALLTQEALLQSVVSEPTIPGKDTLPKAKTRKQKLEEFERQAREYTEFDRPEGVE